MTPIKKCNRPGGVCNRSCMGGGVVGSPEGECPFPEQPERKGWPIWAHLAIWATLFAVVLFFAF